MLTQEIKTQLLRLQLHPVNLDVASEVEENVLLRGSLLACWKVPKTIDAKWFLKTLTALPDLSGPKLTMEAFREAYTREHYARKTDN